MYPRCRLQREHFDTRPVKWLVHSTDKETHSSISFTTRGGPKQLTGAAVESAGSSTHPNGDSDRSARGIRSGGPGTRRANITLLHGSPSRDFVSHSALIKN